MLKTITIVKFEDGWLVLCIDRMLGKVRVRVCERHSTKPKALKAMRNYQFILEKGIDELKKIVDKASEMRYK